eukprot:CAMPEP_0202893646 /NCGR_PEP_ID=MMETSP1392-20130828/3178_1 /ASSEMBLY_ACC=CAM_ASM_000868 /TAXON_ID=225041 /ORGANISM="Chlamydomonas chlamydogama, Strain SAG 11-48b" /LENGTH=107 /DNA_ID=CAMNT_0049578053 /DNA_START=711 /DNA_END=1031 /DNA_ORIENTATION=+
MSSPPCPSSMSPSMQCGDEDHAVPLTQLMGSTPAKLPVTFIDEDKDSRSHRLPFHEELGFVEYEVLPDPADQVRGDPCGGGTSTSCNLTFPANNSSPPLRANTSSSS